MASAPAIGRQRQRGQGRGGSQPWSPALYLRGRRRRLAIGHHTRGVTPGAVHERLPWRQLPRCPRQSVPAARALRCDDGRGSRSAARSSASADSPAFSCAPPPPREPALVAQPSRWAEPLPGVCEVGGVGWGSGTKERGPASVPYLHIFFSFSPPFFFWFRRHHAAARLRDGRPAGRAGLGRSPRRGRRADAPGQEGTKARRQEGPVRRHGSARERGLRVHMYGPGGAGDPSAGSSRLAGLT